MRCLRALAIVVVGGLLCGCQSQQAEEGVYVDLMIEVMIESARHSEGPGDAAQAVSAVEDWRGAGGEGDAD